MTVKESSDTLKVRSTKKLSKTRKVHISYPEDVKLQELEIEMGAGTVYLNRDIETEKLSVEMGAGEFESKNPVTVQYFLRSLFRSGNRNRKYDICRSERQEDRWRMWSG